MFAFINKTASEGACGGPKKAICSTGNRAVFKKVNQSLLMTKIVNAAVNDSGKYKVKAVFSDMHDNTEKVKCLQVHHLNVSGKQWICYRFSPDNNDISSNPKQTLKNWCWI